jgi:anti-sigma factor RsiW
MKTANGYNVLRWSRAGMAYWVVSDLNPAELRQFAELVEQPGAAQSR